MPEVTVECPLCGKIIEIADPNEVSRSDALRDHMNNDCIVNNGLPTPPKIGPPFPKIFGIRWPWKRGK